MVYGTGTWNNSHFWYIQIHTIYKYIYSFRALFQTNDPDPDPEIQTSLITNMP